MEDYERALAVALTAEDFRRIDEIVPPGTHLSQYYQADFGPTARWQ